MSTTNKLHSWLKVALAQRQREAKNITDKYGAEAAKIINTEVGEIQVLMANLASTKPDTPLEKWIKEQK